VSVREVDARSAPDADLLAIHEIEEAHLRELMPDEPPRSADEAIAFLRHQPSTHESYHWLADGGFASLYIHSPTATFMHLIVHPERRCNGVGAALLRSVVARAVERGSVTLRADHASPAGAAFATRHGATNGQRIVHSLLDLRAAELPEPPVPDGWRLVTWFMHVPEEQLAAYVRARGAMDDAPADDDFEYPSATAERVRASEASLVERDREMRLTVALAGDGEIGAFTELRLSRGSTSGFTDDTGTVAAHRGRGLAKAVKLESLRVLRLDHPEVEVVTTSNAEENAVMRHINESVGFRPIATFTTTSLAL
jgi:GNAT superfamily N-acetyltransferase